MVSRPHVAATHVTATHATRTPHAVAHHAGAVGAKDSASGSKGSAHALKLTFNPHYASLETSAKSHKMAQHQPPAHAK
ncbi:MAG: hypothetical protein SGJ27_31490 [Candidatus Melainabacteria bacterium]|nr:hypothetical protein [Candidatus Melainabacteria bacterium]